MEFFLRKFINFTELNSTVSWIPVVDEMNFEILALLQTDGRLSDKVLAARVGLAPSTCHERIKRSSEDGALESVHAVVDPKVLGGGLQAFYMIELVKHDREVVEGFRRDALAIPEVRQVFLVSGKFDFLFGDRLRASATRVFLGPTLRASRAAQALGAHQSLTRTSKELAAS